MQRIPSEEQQSVVSELDENIILFASAGTGKTFTVANRVANIVQSGRAKPEEILCLTFTTKACRELEEDIARYVGNAARDICVKTIHGFCYRLLVEEGRRQTGRRTEPAVFDEVDEEELLREILSSAYPLWRLEEFLREQNLPYTAAELKTLPIARGKGDRKTYFCLEKPKKAWLHHSLRLLEPQEAEEVVERHPLCGQTAVFTHCRCPVCGEETEPRGLLPARSFPIYGKKSSLQNFVSALKHIREEKELYSDDAEADYQAAFTVLKEEKGGKWSDLCSYYAHYDGKRTDEEFAAAMERFAGRLAAEYDRRLESGGRVDFDDVILLANGYLKKEEALARWQTRYKYIVVDEMQDTSELEYSVLKKLFGQNKIMLCGDFFQTIYEWRGSRPSVVLGDYIRSFSPKRFTFSENYRSTQTLTGASFGFLKRVYPDFVGKYCPEQIRINNPKRGEKISCFAFEGKRAEAEGIYEYAQKHRRTGEGDLCVIARSNKYVDDLYTEFEKISRRLPEEERVRFFTVEEDRRFYKKPIVKDVLAVVKLALDPLDGFSMERIAEKYIKRVGAKTLEDIRAQNGVGVSVSSFLSDGTYTHKDPYHGLIESLKEGNVVVYDTETTGLDLERDQIVQISAVRINGAGEIVETLDLLVEPTVEISRQAEKTHGFSMDYIRSHGGLSAKEALVRFSEFVKGKTLVGHNGMRFDAPLIRRQLTDENLPPLEVLGEFDTLAIARMFHAELSDYKLSTLCARFSVVNACAHNALGDITATAACLTRMMEEDLLPTREARRAAVEKYADKFAAFYSFYKALCQKVFDGTISDLAPWIYERMRLKKEDTPLADLVALKDLEESLRSPDTPYAEGFLREYISLASLSGSRIDAFLKNSDKVPVITVHQSKGCEFDTVILAGADDGHFPSAAAKESGNEDEEKKVFYVAITRAKKRLIITRTRRGKASPYCAALPKEYVYASEYWEEDA